MSKQRHGQDADYEVCDHADRCCDDDVQALIIAIVLYALVRKIDSQIPSPYLALILGHPKRIDA